jgi:hypothetical protein
MFYLFGLVLFLVLQSVGVIIGDVGPTGAANQVLRTFTVSWVFAANVFFGPYTAYRPMGRDSQLSGLPRCSGKTSLRPQGYHGLN